jgi:lipid-A-disaccharide synthase
MPNLLADAVVMPEFVQDAATPEALAGALRELLQDPAKLAASRARLQDVARQLGTPGAARRAAAAILRTLPTQG